MTLLVRVVRGHSGRSFQRPREMAAGEEIEKAACADAGMVSAEEDAPSPLPIDCEEVVVDDTQEEIAHGGTAPAAGHGDGVPAAARGDIVPRGKAPAQRANEKGERACEMCDAPKAGGSSPFCPVHKRVYDALLRQSRKSAADKAYVKKIRTTEEFHKLMTKFEAATSTESGRKQRTQFDFAEFKETLRCKAGSTVEVIGKPMSWRKYHAWATDNQGGEMTSQEAEKEWERMKSDPAWPRDSKGRDGALRLWVIADEQARGWNETEHAREIQKTQKVKGPLTAERQQELQQELSQGLGSLSSGISKAPAKASSRSPRRTPSWVPVLWLRGRAPPRLLLQSCWVDKLRAGSTSRWTCGRCYCPVLRRRVLRLLLRQRRCHLRRRRRRASKKSRTAAAALPRPWSLRRLCLRLGGLGRSRPAAAAAVAAAADGRKARSPSIAASTRRCRGGPPCPSYGPSWKSTLQNAWRRMALCSLARSRRS